MGFLEQRQQVIGGNAPQTPSGGGASGGAGGRFLSQRQQVLSATQQPTQRPTSQPVFKQPANKSQPASNQSGNWFQNMFGTVEKAAQKFGSQAAKGIESWAGNVKTDPKGFTFDTGKSAFKGIYDTAAGLLHLSNRISDWENSHLPAPFHNYSAVRKFTGAAEKVTSQIANDPRLKPTSAAGKQSGWAAEQLGFLAAPEVKGAQLAEKAPAFLKFLAGKAPEAAKWTGLSQAQYKAQPGTSEMQGRIHDALLNLVPYIGIEATRIGGGKMIGKFFEGTRDASHVVAPEVAHTPAAMMPYHAIADQYQNAGDFASHYSVTPDHKLSWFKPGEVVSRDPIDEKAVQDYMAKIQAGQEIDPIRVTKENGKWVTTDGSHKVEAYKRLGLATPVISKEAIPGAKTMAQIFYDAKHITPGEEAVNEMKAIMDHTPQKSVMVTSGINPGLDQLITDDIIPKAAGMKGWVSDLVTEIRQRFNPKSLVDNTTLDKVFKFKGDNDYFKFINRERWKNYQMMGKQYDLGKFWDKYGGKEGKDNLDFLNNYERGVKMDGVLGHLQDLYHARNDAVWEKISKWKDVNKVENYFRRMWEQAGGKEKDFNALYSRQRSLQGSTSWQKQRVFKFLTDGMDKGFIPKETNPEVLMQIAEENAARFDHAQILWQDLKQLGKLSFVKNGAKVPEGFVKLNDKIASVYYPTETKTKAGKQIFAKSGEYYVEEPVANLIKNYLSPDKFSASKIGGLLQSQKALFNGVQLGLSGFHPTFLAIDSLANQLNNAARSTVRGDFKALPKQFGKTPTAAINYYINANKMIKKALTNDPESLAALQLAARAGSKIKQPEGYKASVLDNFNKNLRSGNYIGAMFRMPYATMEASTRPLFDEFIPKVKLGAFFENYGQAVAERSADIAAGVVTKETLARQVYRDIEDRMGELNYDNMFWDNSMKGALQAFMRAPGWFKGTVGTFAGGLSDNAKFLLDTGKYVTRQGGKPYLTQRGSYLFAMLFTTASIGATYQYLKTGQKPSSLKDYFMPKNGSKDANGNEGRIILPTYFKDVISARSDPLAYITNKAAPEISILWQIISNKDFFNNPIRNTNDPASTQFLQEMKYIARASTPFSFQQFGAQKQSGASTEQQAEAFLGFLKASSKNTQSSFQQTVQDELQAQGGFGGGGQTPEAQDRNALLRQARVAAKAGDDSQLQSMFDSGQISSLKQQEAAASRSPVVNMFLKLSPAAKIKALEKATPDQKQMIADQDPGLFKTLRREQRRRTTSQVKKDEIEQVLTLLGQ